ncbi:MAG: hypothetical protein PHV75_09270 [Victivallaceae bacterium]|nr:hypothetical protein [Victivallaceae bacterium]MDD3704429.1 hypothetical protein [Victivallaceae bacterium]MDD4318691.1 hypothetical protein [Victivallaceae bacterium]NLK83802.1 hypothetical protein [Lentisphaerota bacterium]
MKKISLLTILAVLLIVGAGLSAAMWRFRLGVISVAEITTSQVRVTNLDPHAFPDNYDRTAYAVVVCKLDPMRSLSIYDFTLRDSKFRRYPCIALRAGLGDFDGEKWKIDRTVPDSWYSMLFKLESPIVATGSTVKMTLEYTYTLGESANLEVPFKFIGRNSLTSVNQIPSTGKLPNRP